jgi:hypothetical protein
MVPVPAQLGRPSPRWGIPGGITGACVDGHAGLYFSHNLLLSLLSHKRPHLAGRLWFRLHGVVFPHPMMTAQLPSQGK